MSTPDAHTQPIQKKNTTHYNDAIYKKIPKIKLMPHSISNALQLLPLLVCNGCIFASGVDRVLGTNSKFRCKHYCTV